MKSGYADKNISQESWLVWTTKINKSKVVSVEKDI